MPSRFEYQLADHRVEHAVDLPVHALKLDPELQRETNKARARSIAANLIPSAIGTITVSRRSNGDYYVIDGMHRVAALRRAGMETVKCEVHYGLSRPDEAVLFLVKNREAKAPTTLDQYRVGLAAGLPLFIETEQVLDAHGLKVARCPSTNNVGAIAAILSITEELTAAVLDRTLTVAEAAFGRAGESWAGPILTGLATFLSRHGDTVNDAQLARRMVRTGPAEAWSGRIHSIAKGAGYGGGSRTASYRLILDAWNKGRAKKIDVPN